MDIADWGRAEVSACVDTSQQPLVSQWGLPAEAQCPANGYPASVSDVFVSSQLRAQGGKHMLCSGPSKADKE